ncbi:MAG TPA: DUF192 domain-containing protein [Candidatus Limnocylindrales bacterium]|nr:DUF192 domain-containing protein [Candidatus Limnocylindrales bacterium]
MRAPYVEIRNVTRSSIVAGRVSVADTFWTRFLGLMGRPELEPGEGLWLTGVNNIHMLFMRFPIDCAFLGPADVDGPRVVVAVRHRLAPWRGVVWYVRGAAGVVELPAGSLAKSGTVVGDRLLLTIPGAPVDQRP